VKMAEASSNIGSTASRVTPPTSAVYTATKGAVDAITQVLPKELGPTKIRVNSINPAMVETEGVRAAGFVSSDFQKPFEAQTPLEAASLSPTTSRRSRYSWRPPTRAGSPEKRYWRPAGCVKRLRKAVVAYDTSGHPVLLFFSLSILPPSEVHVPCGRIDSDLPKDCLQSSDARGSDSQAKRFRR